MRGEAVMKHRIGLISVFGVWLVTMLAVPAQAELNIDGYSLVSKTRVSRVAFNYTYRAEITNTGPEVENVAAELSSKNPNTLIVDDSLNFGSIAAGDTVTSTDTFTIRQDRRHPFNWANMSWDIAFDTPIPAGVLLQGDPGDLALNSLVNMHPTPVGDSQIRDSVILSRLTVMIARDATVSEINQTLLHINARITTMRAGSSTMTLAIPMEPTIEAITQVANQLATSPSILFAFPARIPGPAILPPGHADPTNVRDTVQHLMPTRFPAAWNAEGLIEFDADGNCANPVIVLVADIWLKKPIHPDAYIQAYEEAAQDQLLLSAPIYAGDNQAEAIWTPFHGYDVMSTMGAKFDTEPPTGAMPLSECFDFIPVPMNGYSWFDKLWILRDKFPDDEKFLINASLKFWNDDADISPEETNELFGPLQRAQLALEWRLLTIDREDDFLVLSAASNDADRPSDGSVYLGEVYPGTVDAAYSNPFNVAARGGALLQFAADSALWGASGVYPDLTPTADQMLALQAELSASNPKIDRELNNVLIVGSTTNKELRQDLTESDFSDRGADVYAVGEGIPNLVSSKRIEGTSFSAPQVTGLAAYLWLIAPELRQVPAPITRYLIEQSVVPVVTAANGGDNLNLIDAYLAALTFDLDPDTIGIPVIQFGEAPVREAILDIDGDEVFEEEDLKRYLHAYYDGDFLDPEVPPILPSIRNYSRFDLNGDGFTGGESVDRFDLDLLASPEVTPVYDQILLPITLPSASMPIERSFDENSLTDLDILCYYAFSPLYYGDLIGVRGLGSLTWLSDCVDIETVFDPPSDILLSSTVQFAAHVLDAENRTLVDSTEALGWEQFRWTSSNPAVAVVDALGRLHVAGTGSTTIGVSYGRAATSGVLSVQFEESLLEPTDVYSNMDYNSVLGACQLQSGSGEGGSHSIYLNQFVFENAVVLETVADVANVRDPALVWVRATGGIMPTDVVYPASGDVILQYGVPGFVLSEILAAGTDAEGCPSISYRSYGYQPHVADTPWPLWQLPVTSALPYTGAIEQPLWIEIEPPVPALLGAGEAALRSTAGNAALQITIAENGTHSVNISAVAPWVVSWVSAVNPIDERERIIAIVERDGVAYEIDLALAVQEDEGGRFLEVEELTGWHCGLGIGGQCPGWFDTNIAGSP